PDPDRVAKLVRIESGKTLDYLLAPDDWYELRDVMRGTVKEDDLRRFRPWYAMVRLTQKLRPPPEETMDEALAARAKRAGKPVDALEAWHEQLEVLAAAVGVQDLRDAIHARKKVRCELDGMLAFYVAGDADAMQKWLDMPSSAQLLGARNAKWLAKLEGYAATGGAFVAVGLGHLIGDDNLPTLLAARGYAVARVP
ncbi:MAG TPA: TraB/GumN family protein, partial [Kofleriaceae bacterium]|nr:TraB/GumN family protein [Kofleriaceae bacterium]